MTDLSSSGSTSVESSSVSVDDGGPPRSGGGGGSGGSIPPVRAASDRVVASWGGEPESRKELRGEISRLASFVERTCEEGSVPDVSGEATALRLELLERLRGEILAEPLDDRDEDPGELVRLLRSLERVRNALATDWRGRFGLARAAPSGIDVAAEIAHGLRSSCTSLLFATEVLREGMYGELNPKQKQQVEVLYGGAVGLTAGLSDITELAWTVKEPAGRTADTFDLQEDLDWVEGLLRPIAEANGTRFTISTDVPSRRTGHSRAVRRALLNLLLHTLKRSEGGSVDVEVREKGETNIRIEVRGRSEDGPDPELHDDPFHILRQALDDDGYSFSIPGLRLHTARELIRALGGELDYRDDDGRVDVDFTLRLPRGE